jgi:hypothetical protein
MTMRNFSKKIIWIQILCGLLFAIVANPYLVYPLLYHSWILVLLQMIFMSVILINAILKSSREDFKKAFAMNYFLHYRNYFTVFLFALVEALFLSYLYGKYLMKKDLDPVVYIIIPAGVAFIVLQLVSWLIRNGRYHLRSN